MTVLKALKRNVLSIRYLLIFLLFLILILNALSQEFLENIGLSEFFIRTASEVSFLQNILTRHYMTVLVISAPLLTTVACSSLFVDDYEANMLGSIFTRTSVKKYHVSNIIATFISAFLLVFLPLITGYLVALIACPPTIALDNMSAMSTYFIGNYNTGLLGVWQIFNPILFTVFHILLASFIFSLCACLGYLISMVAKWSRYISISIVFGVYMIYNIGLTKLGFADITFFNLIDPYAQKVSIPIILLILFLLSVLLFLIFVIILIKKGDDNG